MSDYHDAACGICGLPPAWLATVPMCGERPRYPLCSECLDDIVVYAEVIDLIGLDA
jgi:hypothetical protein